MVANIADMPTYMPNDGDSVSDNAGHDYRRLVPEQKVLKEFRKNSLIFSSKQFLEIEFGNS